MSHMSAVNKSQAFQYLQANPQTKVKPEPMPQTHHQSSTPATISPPNNGKQNSIGHHIDTYA